MLARKVDRIIDAIAFKRLFASVSPPIQEISIGALLVCGTKQHVFMIATKADKISILLSPTIDQEIEDVLALRSPVNVIANEDELSALPTAKGIARG